MGQMTLGIDVACRAAHQASLADERGKFAWTGRRFRTTAADLERLWALVPAAVTVTVVMEPTRNAWVPLAAWFRRRGATVILVPPEQSADLRASLQARGRRPPGLRMLARLPLLHPEGLLVGRWPGGWAAARHQAARQPGQAAQRHPGPPRYLPGAAGPGLARCTRR